MNDKIRHFESSECRRIQGLLDDFLADELSIETNQSILSHLEDCSLCGQERQRRERLKLTLRTSWNALTSPSPLKSKIEHDTLSPYRLLPFPFRLAATLLITLVGAALFLTLTGQLQLDETQLQAVDHYRFAVQDHLECKGRPLSADESILRISGLIEQNYPAYQFAGAMDCDVGEASFTHYMFRNSNSAELLSVLIEEHEEDQTLPERGKRLDLGDLTLRRVQEGSVALVSLETEHHFLYMIGDGFSSQEFAVLTERVAPSLKSALLAVG